MSSFKQPKGMVAYGDMKVMLKRRHACNVYFIHSLQNTTSFYRPHKTNYRIHEKFPTRLNG